MRTFSVITTFNKKGYKKYGARMIEAFDRNWPKEISLYVYWEDYKPDYISERIHYINLLESCPDLVSFVNRWKNDPQKNGVEAGSVIGFKWNAVRFSYKTFAIIHAAKNLTSDVVIWLDADTFTFAPIPDTRFFEKLLPNDEKTYVSYLGRGIKKYPECGFVMYNTKHSQNAAFMQYWESLYKDDTLFKLKEWHDSFVFDEIRKDFEAKGLITSYNLSPDSLGEGHPFINSALGQYIDHVKGDIRKDLGNSWGVDIKNFHKGNPYWDKIRNNPQLRNKATSKMYLKQKKAEENK